MRALSKQERIVRRRKQLLATTIIFVALLISAICFSIRINAKDSKDIYKYYTSYEVQPGDTLWSIADTYMTIENHDRDAYISEIKEMNHIVDDKITSGEYLVISYYSYDFY